MKKLLLILLFVPLVSFGQKVEHNLKDLEAFRALMVDNSDSANMFDRYKFFDKNPYQLDVDRSFFKGSWWAYLQNNGFLIKLLEEILGMPVFNSGPHKEYFKGDSKEFGHYNPMFLEKVIKKFKSLSPASKQIIQPFYYSHFKIPLGELMNKQVSLNSKGEEKSLIIQQIKNNTGSSSSKLSYETLFWLRRISDGTSDEFRKLFILIIKEFDSDYISVKENEDDINDLVKGISSTFLGKHNNTIWTDGLSTLRFRKLSSIKYLESSKKQIKGYVFDGFLKKSAGNGNLYNDKGYFIIQDKIKNLKNIYDINAKSGLNVRESPGTSGKIVDKLESGIVVKILKKTGESFEVEGIEGEWVEIETYDPFGHRQQFGLGSLANSVFTNEVSDDRTGLECTMCGYKKITQNVRDILSFVENVRNDFGDIESEDNSFLIDTNELIHTLELENPAGKVFVKSRLIPLNSDPAYIEEVKKENKTNYDSFNDKWQRIRQEYENMIMDEEY